MIPLDRMFTRCFLIGWLTGNVRTTDSFQNARNVPGICRVFVFFLLIRLNLMAHLDGTFNGMSKVCCLMSHRPKGRGAVRRMVSFKPTGLYAICYNTKRTRISFFMYRFSWKVFFYKILTFTIAFLITMFFYLFVWRWVRDHFLLKPPRIFSNWLIYVLINMIRCGFTH